jgi:hypothetical protein
MATKTMQSLTGEIGFAIPATSSA